MKKLTLILGCTIIALALLLSACEQPTPTISPLPTLSPLQTPMVPMKQAALTISESGSQVVNSTIELWWDNPLIPSGVLAVKLSGHTTIGETTILSYTCEPSYTIACVNYPFTRTIPSAGLNDSLVFTFTVVVDTEARIDDAIYDSDTQSLPFTSHAESGVGQENGAIPFSWEPALPSNVSGNVEIWQRIRGIDIDNNLPDITVPYYVNIDGVQTHDSRGFFLIETYVAKPTYIMYFPFIMKGD